ncbi:hypothetical protein [Bacillus massiliglaciei]|uniref:hypothetical protein n=1 Tax=Bacillus massiliglaciei TaxID=1816693 RepID=UPI000DA629D9|nr:hypothetical protein [Bacillus massiliglaciei]
MKLKVSFYFPGGQELSHEAEAEDSTQMISVIQKHRHYNLTKGDAYYVVDTDKVAYYCVTELKE